MLQIIALKNNNKLLILLFCSMGFISALYLQKYLLIPSFVASAGVGFVGSFIPKSKYYDFKQLIACVYTGSFASMCSLELFSSPLHVLMICFLLGGSFIMFSTYLKGVGGKLGAIAFVSSLFFVLLKGIL